VFDNIASTPVSKIEKLAPWSDKIPDDLKRKDDCR